MNSPLIHFRFAPVALLCLLSISQLAQAMVLLDDTPLKVEKIKGAGLWVSHPDACESESQVRVTVKANVARSEDEAKLQSQGIDILSQMAEEEAAADAASGFQEAIDPDRELGELPSDDDDAGEVQADGEDGETAAS